MWIDNAPASLVETRPLGIVCLDIHGQFKTCFGNPFRKIEIRFERKFFRKIGKRAVHFHGPAPIPLANRSEFGHARTLPVAEKLRIRQWIKCFPAKRRFRQPAITSMNIEADRPELVVIRLTHLHFRHPVKNFTGIEIAENPALELQKQGRMNGITEIEQCVWSSQSIEQSRFRHSDAFHTLKIMRVGCGLLIQQAVPAGECMLAQSSLEIRDSGPVGAEIVCRRQQLQPDRIELQSAQSKHPLQRHRKIATALAVFCSKPAPEKNGHASRIAVRIDRSSANTMFTGSLEVIARSAVATLQRPNREYPKRCSARNR